MDVIANWLGMLSPAESMFALFSLMIGLLILTAAAVTAVVVFVTSFDVRYQRGLLLGLLAYAGVDSGAVGFRDRLGAAAFGVLGFPYRSRRFSLWKTGGYPDRAPSRWHLKVAAKADGDFQVTSENVAQRLMDNLWAGGKLSTGDVGFDADFHVSADEPNFAAAFFMASEKRRFVREIIALGCDQLILHDDSFTAGSSGGPSTGPEFKNLLDAMVGLADGLPDVPPRPDAIYDRLANPLVIGMLAIFAGILVGCVQIWTRHAAPMRERASGAYRRPYSGR